MEPFDRPLPDRNSSALNVDESMRQVLRIEASRAGPSIPAAASHAGRSRYEPGLDDSIDPREVLAKFWARKRLVFASIFICAGVAYLGAKLVTPIYNGSAYVMVVAQQPEGAAGGPNPAVAIAAGPDLTGAVQTQAFILQSRDLAAEAVARLHLDRDPEFNPLLRGPNPLLAPVRLISGLFAGLAGRASDSLGGSADPSQGGETPATAEVAHQHPDRDPQFNSAHREPNPLLAPVRWISALFAKLAGQVSDSSGGAADLAPGGEAPATAEKTGAVPGTQPSTAAVDEFMKRLHVAPQEHSTVIQVSFGSSSPKTAALVPNTLVELFLENQVTNKTNALKGEIAWLDKIVPELRQKMIAAELDLAEYRQRYGAASEKDPTIAAQELAQIRTELAAAGARKADAAARLGQVNALLSPRQGRSAPAGATAATATDLASPVLEHLHEEEAALVAKLAASSGLLGSRNPEIMGLEAQRAAVKTGIRSEAARATTRLRADLAAAAATEAVLERQEKELTHQLAQVSGGDPRLASLHDAAGADRKVYEKYMTRANEARNEIGNLGPDARIVSAAAVPLKPVFPNTKLLVVVGATIGAGVGVVLAATIGGLLGGLRSARQVEDVVGIRCLGWLPRLTPRRRRRSFAAEVRRAIEDPASAGARVTAFGQAVRSIQFKLVGVERGSRSQVVLVTAALPGEGKSWLAASLATSLATEGFRVVLVDCDPHRPVVHRMFDGPRGPGLTDYFAGGAGIDQVVHRDVASGVEYVPIGTDRSRGSWYITFDRLHGLLGQLRQTHRFIILNSAPVLAVSETAMLSQLAHKTILVIRWGRTGGQIVCHAARQLFDSGAAEVAAVLSMTDFRIAAKYGDAVAGTYSRMESYYTGRARPST